METLLTRELALRPWFLGWLNSGGSTPLVDVFTQASAYMVDYHLSALFQALRPEHHYLRIEVGYLKNILIISLDMQIS